MADSNRPEGDKTPSADEIIEALAQEMGVDEGGDKAQPQSGPEPPSNVPEAAQQLSSLGWPEP